MQRYNPIHLTGLARHCYLWATSSWSDVFIPNDGFDPESPCKRTIYCIHGTADRVSSFSLIAERLQGKLACDVSGIHMITFSNRFSGASVNDFATQLKDRILQNHDDNVMLMGHSRGALVASVFALEHANEAGIFVDSVIGICGPFRGSYAAWPFAMFSNSVSEMQTDSPFLKRLSQQIQQSNIRFLFAGCENDYLVTGQSYLPYGVNADNENALYLDRHGHLSIGSSHRLVNWIAEKIAASKTIEMHPLNQNTANALSP